MTLGMIAECDNGLGDYAHSESHIRRAVEMLREYGELDIQFNMYSWSLACTLLAKGELLQAKSILEACVRASRQKLGKHTLARNLATLSRAQLALGDIKNATTNAREALDLFLVHPHFHWYLYGLATLASVLAENGEVQRAVEVYACVTASPLAGYSQWFEDVYGRDIRNLASLIQADAYEAACQRGSQADPWQIGRDLLKDYFLI
jgi:tetratricopeptide (TPR) repeat protein